VYFDLSPRGMILSPIQGHGRLSKDDVASNLIPVGRHLDFSNFFWHKGCRTSWWKQVAKFAARKLVIP